MRAAWCWSWWSPASSSSSWWPRRRSGGGADPAPCPARSSSGPSSASRSCSSGCTTASSTTTGPCAATRSSSLRLGQSYAAGALALGFVYYLFPVVRVGPGTLLLGLPLSAAAIVVWHTAHRWTADREALCDNVLIVGSGAIARQIAAEMLRRAPRGYRVVGFLGTHPAEMGRRLGNPAVVGTMADLLPLVALAPGERHRRRAGGPARPPARSRTCSGAAWRESASRTPRASSSG